MLKFTYRSLSAWFIITAFILSAFFIAPKPIAAESKLRINLGLWVGEYTPELEKRFFIDDLLSGTSFGRLNFDWQNIPIYTLYPAGFELSFPVGNGEGVLGGNLINYSGDVAYDGFNFAPAFSTTTLNQFSSNDWEVYGGYRYLFDKFSITPRAGLRRHTETFSYQEMTFGSNVVILDAGENRWDSSVFSTFIAAEGRYKISEKLELVGDLMISPPLLANWAGRMDNDRVLLELSGNSIGFQFDSASSGYTLNFQRISLGVEYSLNETAKLQFGIRQETTEASYPDYFNMPITIRSNGIESGLDRTEFLTDYFFYSQGFTTEKGRWYATLSLVI